MTQCPTCGAGIEAAAGRCRKCGTLIQSSVAAAAVPAATFTPIQMPVGSQAGAAQMPAFAGLGPYYQNEFEQIYRSNEAYKGRWNWAAFFFGPIWAASKGLWVNAILFFCLGFVLSALSMGVLGLAVGVIYGVRGNYFYYSHLVKGKQVAF
jgi:uncharacterized protein DUF2628